MSNNNNVILSIKRLGETSFTDYSSIFTFSFLKERYTPFTLLRIRAVYDCDNADIADVKLTVNGKLIHHGILDYCVVEKTFGRRIISIVSRGFTSLLGQNELAPGVKTQLSLIGLMTSLPAIRNVTWEQNNNTARIVYVKEHSSQWDAVVNTCLAVYHTHPYIAGTNELRFTSPAVSSVSHNGKIICVGNGADYTRLISAMHMKDSSGTYNSYNYTDGFAAARGIVREKYIEFDKQWLAESTFGLNYKLNYAERGSRYEYLRYKGYDGEDICRNVDISPSRTLTLSKLEISGDSKGITTTNTFYHDKYCN